MAYIPHSQPDNTSELNAIENDDFFPQLSLQEFRAAFRVDPVVSDERAVHQIHIAMYAVNKDLQLLKNEFIVNDQFFEGESANYEQTRRGNLYKDAVYNRAKGSIIENYRDIDTAGKGDQRADKMEMRIEDYFQKSREAVRLLLGKSRMTVELI